MKIDNYLKKLEGQHKRHVLLIVTPKNKYPNQFLHDDFLDLEGTILAKPKEYISLYDKNEHEIMQYVAFRLFLKSVICDKYSLINRVTTKVKRINEDEIISFFIAKSFYNTVPSGKKIEKDAIEYGMNEGKSFLEKFPLNKFEYASIALEKDSNEANVLISLDFQNRSSKYYFEYVYVC